MRKGVNTKKGQKKVSGGLPVCQLMRLSKWSLLSEGNLKVRLKTDYQEYKQ